MPIRERVIEEYLRKRVKSVGGIAIKLTSSNLRAIPDRLCLFPGGHIAFIELKAPGRKPSPAQKLFISMLKRMGFVALVIDSRPRVDALMKWVEENWDDI